MDPGAPPTIAMTERTVRERIILHDDIGAMEADFSGMTFASEAQVDAFYDEADRVLAETGKRWYFLVVYTDCTIDPGVWPRFAARGKQTNINYGLGTARVGTSAAHRQTIREHAKSEMFRANIYDSREQALVALGEMRRRHALLGEAGAFETAAGEAPPVLQVEGIQLSFGGVTAINNVGFGVNRGEISSIIGPNGAGKSSMLNVISGFYRPSHGRITFEGKDRTHLPAHAAKPQPAPPIAAMQPKAVATSGSPLMLFVPAI